MPQRKYSTDIVFTFDALLDLDIGVVTVIREDFLFNDSPSNYINYSFLQSADDIDELKRIRMEDMDRNIVKECFLGKARDEYLDLYKEYLETEPDRVFAMSPATDMVRLIKMYIRTKFIHPIVICTRKEEVSIINELLDGKCETRLVASYNDVSLDGVARLCVANISDVLSFRGLKCLHIAVLNYACNFTLSKQEGKEVKMLLPHVTLPLWDINEFEIMNPYRLEDLKEDNENASNQY